MSNEAEAPQIQRRGLMLVLSSPSGAGKTTLSRRLLQTDPDIVMSVSATTRAPRPNEVEGQEFGVNIIPHTWEVTTLGRLSAGAKVNLEIDVLARYAARWQETA